MGAIASASDFLDSWDEQAPTPPRLKASRQCLVHFPVPSLVRLCDWGTCG